MRITLAAIIVLSMLSAGIWYAVYEQPRREDLTVSFLDVGQGTRQSDSAHASDRDALV
jgi:beta-lactamase superfamily II metal-dependent hydrolase